MQRYAKYYYIYYISLLLCLSILIIKLKNLLQSELRKTGKVMFCTKCSIFLLASDLKQVPLKNGMSVNFFGKGLIKFFSPKFQKDSSIIERGHAILNIFFTNLGLKEFLNI